jgi:hypothetical protein
MYENTTYKAFVAETAAKIAAEISAKFVTAQDTSLLAKDEATQHDIAVAAISVADKLAGKLEDWWQARGDHKTVMFDPADSLTSKMECELSEIADNIETICDQFRVGLSVNIVSEDD